MTNREIRAWYLKGIGKIARMDIARARQGDTLPQRAYQAWYARRELRLRAREMMENREEVEMLRERDLAKYGDPNGPAFEDLVQALRRNGVPAETAFQRILDSARQTNAEFNKLVEGL